LPAIWKSQCRATSLSRGAIRRVRQSLEPGRRSSGRGQQHISRVIKIPDASTWSHAASMVEPSWAPIPSWRAPRLIRPRSAKASCRRRFRNTTRSHPHLPTVGLSQEDCETVLQAMPSKHRLRYDLRNHHRFDALSGSVAGAAALAPAHDALGSGNPTPSSAPR